MASSRREFLINGLRASALAALYGCRSSRPIVAQATAPFVAIDMHNHVYPTGTEPHPHGMPEASGDALPLDAALTRSGFTAVCASYVLDFSSIEGPGDAYRNYTAWLDAIDAQLAAGHVHRALTARDLDAGPTIIQTVEGAMFIEGQLSRLDEVYARGVRHLQLLHEKDDLVAPLGDVNTAPAHLGGLTATGADVIRECNRLGIVVDLAHASHETILGALKVADQPLVVSHTSLAERPTANPRMGEMMKPRLITKEHVKVVADTGGIIGVWTHMAESLADFVDSILAMVDAIGVDHVGIGTDSDLLSAQPGHGTTQMWGISGSFVDALTHELTTHGAHPTEIAKIVGGNYARLFRAVTRS